MFTRTAITRLFDKSEVRDTPCIYRGNVYVDTVGAEYIKTSASGCALVRRI